ncbi:ROK family protein [Salinicoccus sp. HZC-1]|uniref:ROK family transcriptional regulator n=1 Tax=Salinicoccus sp. HZC-1 TaxID=3385497 RepID=UPI00398AA528
MTKSVINQQSIKQFNTNKILKLITSIDTISRADLAKQTGLNKATVSKITDELLNDNLVEDLGYGISSGGRKPKLLRFNPNAKYVVGINIGVRDIDFTVMNMQLEVPYSTRIEIENTDYNVVSQYLEDTFNAALDELRINAERIIEVTIAVPGTVDSDGVIIHAPNLGWKDLDLSETLGSTFHHLPIRVFNEANAGALGELNHIANPENQNLVYVSAGIGIGTGIIISGNLYKGRMGTAGEFGHNTIVENGRQCHCGRKGCWEMYASEQALYDSLNQKNINIDLSIENVLSELESNNEKVIESTNELSLYLNIGLENVARALNPDYIVIGNKLKYLIDYLNVDEEMQGSKIVFSKSDRHTTIEGMVSVITRKYLYQNRYSLKSI